MALNEFLDLAGLQTYDTNIKEYINNEIEDAAINLENDIADNSLKQTTQNVTSQDKFLVNASGGTVEDDTREVLVGNRYQQIRLIGNAKAYVETPADSYTVTITFHYVDNTTSIETITSDSDLVYFNVTSTLNKIVEYVGMSIDPTLHEPDYDFTLIGYSDTNNTAISVNSIALGVNSTAGIKGWYWMAYCPDTYHLYLTGIQNTPSIVSEAEEDSYYDPSFETNIQENDALFIVNGNHYDNVLVEGVDGNKITLANSPFLTVVADTGIDAYAVGDLTQPAIGLIDFGLAAFASGVNSKALQMYAAVFGYNNTAAGQYSFAAGRDNIASYAGVAAGRGNKALGEQSITLGKGNVADKNNAVAIGLNTQARAEAANASGIGTIASGYAANATGNNTQAKGASSESSGYGVIAQGDYTHAEGGVLAANLGTLGIAKGPYSHLEGLDNLTGANAQAAHVEGRQNEANGNQSHAGGYQTVVDGARAFAHGRGLQAKAENQAVFGKYNADNNNALLIVGNGSASNNRGNAFTVNANGTATLQTNPINNMDVATKGYVDTAISPIGTRVTKLEAQEIRVVVPTNTNISTYLTNLGYTTAQFANIVAIQDGKIYRYLEGTQTVTDSHSMSELVFAPSTEPGYEHADVYQDITDFFAGHSAHFPCTVSITPNTLEQSSAGHDLSMDLVDADTNPNILATLGAYNDESYWQFTSATVDNAAENYFLRVSGGIDGDDITFTNDYNFNITYNITAYNWYFVTTEEIPGVMQPPAYIDQEYGQINKKSIIAPYFDENGNLINSANGRMAIAMGKSNHANGTYSTVLGAFNKAGRASELNWATIGGQFVTGGNNRADGLRQIVAGGYNDAYVTATYADVGGYGSGRSGEGITNDGNKVGLNLDFTSADAATYFGVYVEPTYGEYKCPDTHLGYGAFVRGKTNTVLGCLPFVIGSTNTVYQTSLLASVEGSSNTVGQDVLGDVDNVNHTVSYPASGTYVHVEGSRNTEIGNYDHTEGFDNLSSGHVSHIEGRANKQQGRYTHIEGLYNTTDDSTTNKAFTSPNSSTSTTDNVQLNHIEGYHNTVSGYLDHVEGSDNTVNYTNHHIEGTGHTVGATINSDRDHVEGSAHTVDGSINHVEGRGHTVQTNLNHVEGDNNTVYGANNQPSTKTARNHVEGYGNTVNAELDYVHVQGFTNIATVQGADVGGRNNTCATQWGTVRGKYATTNITDGLLVIGNGTGANARSNAFIVHTDGRATVGAEPTQNMDVSTKQYVDNLGILTVSVDAGEYNSERYYVPIDLEYNQCHGKDLRILRHTSGSTRIDFPVLSMTDTANEVILNVLVSIKDDDTAGTPHVVTLTALNENV